MTIKGDAIAVRARFNIFWRLVFGATPLHPASGPVITKMSLVPERPLVNAPSPGLAGACQVPFPRIWE
jgi:hypothetical protein